MDDNIASLPMQTNIALQSARMEAMKQRTDALAGGSAELTPEKKAEYAKAARGFESMFVHEMYKGMRQSMLTHDDGDEDGDGSMGFGNDTLEGFTDLQFADFVSQNGRGMGLAEMMYKHLSGGGQLPSTITQRHMPVAPSEEVASLPAATADQEKVKKTISFIDGLSSAGSRDTLVERVNKRLSSYEDDIAAASTTYNVPTSLIKAIITAESAGNPHAVSPVGAKGLMQLMDGTAREVSVTNPFDATQNIKGGTKYIARMLNSFGSLEHAVAAYNAGPGNVQKHGGVPPFAETKAYVRKVMRYMSEYRSLDNISS